MKTMTKQSTKTISRDAMKALEEVAKNHGLELTNLGGVYNPDGGTFRQRIEWSIPVDLLKVEPPTSQDLHWGYATRGARAIYGMEPKREVIILGARREKYEFRFEDEPEKTYLAKFESFRSVLPLDS